MMYFILFKQNDFSILDVHTELLSILGYTKDELRSMNLLSILNDEMKGIHEKIINKPSSFDFNTKNFKAMQSLNMIPLRGKNDSYCMLSFKGVDLNEDGNYIFKFAKLNHEDNIQVPKYFHKHISGDPFQTYIEDFDNVYVICFDIVNSTELSLTSTSSQLAYIYNNFYKIVHNNIHKNGYPYIRIHETCGDSIMLIANIKFLPTKKTLVELIYKTCKSIINEFYNKTKYAIRCGISQGNISAGIIDGTNFRIFGSTVHLASRLESVCIPHFIAFKKEIVEENSDFFSTLTLTNKYDFLKGFGIVNYYIVSVY